MEGRTPTSSNDNKSTSRTKSNKADDSGDEEVDDFIDINKIPQKKFVKTESAAVFQPTMLRKGIGSPNHERRVSRGQLSPFKNNIAETAKTMDSLCLDVSDPKRTSHKKSPSVEFAESLSEEKKEYETNIDSLEEENTGLKVILDYNVVNIIEIKSAEENSSFETEKKKVEEFPKTGNKQTIVLIQEEAYENNLGSLEKAIQEQSNITTYTPKRNSVNKIETQKRRASSLKKIGEQRIATNKKSVSFTQDQIKEFIKGESINDIDAKLDADDVKSNPSNDNSEDEKENAKTEVKKVGNKDQNKPEIKPQEKTDQPKIRPSLIARLMELDDEDDN